MVDQAHAGIDPWALLETLSSGLVVLDANGIIRYTNAAARRLLLGSGETILTEGVSFFANAVTCLGPGAEVLVEGVQAVAAGQRADAKVELCCEGAEQNRWLAVIVAPAPLGDARAIALQIDEITSRKVVEEALQQAEYKLASYFELSPLAVMEWDLEIRCVAWNPAAEKIFGYSREEAVGRHATELMIHPEIRELAEALWQEFISKGEAKHHINENIRKDGQVILCEWFNVPFRDITGRIAGVWMAGQDITERRNAEEALRRGALLLKQKAVEAEAQAQEKDRLLCELDQKLELIERQSGQIRELSAPILELWDRVIVVPIIGVMDAQRSSDLMLRLLPDITARQAGHVIFDLTGVETMDNTAADQLARIVQAVQLLGARAALSGIQPAVARTMVELGIALSSIPSHRTLREALRACIRGRFRA